MFSGPTWGVVGTIGFALLALGARLMLVSKARNDKWDKEMKGVGRPQTPPPWSARQREEERVSNIVRPNDEEARGNLDGGILENSRQAIEPVAEWTAEKRVSGDLTRSPSLSRPSFMVPSIHRLSGPQSISNRSSNSSFGSPSIQSHRRFSSTTDLVSQPEPSPSVRPTLRAIPRRYAGIDINAVVRASQTPTISTHADPLYTVSTLPSYPATAQSLPPPSYSDLVRTHSERTIAGTHVIPAYGRNPTDSMPDIERVNEQRSGV